MRVAMLTPANFPRAGVETAMALAESVGLAGIIGIQPRPPSGGPADAIDFARERCIEHWLVPETNHPDTVRGLRDGRFDVVVAFRAGIVRPILLELGGIDFINAHAGRVPRYRGRDTDLWAILNRDPVLGTVHRMDIGIDTGDLLLEAPLDLGRPTTLEELTPARRRAQWGLVVPALEGLAAGRLDFRPQPRHQRARQWYRMHPSLRPVVEQRLADGSFHAVQARALASWSATDSVA